MGEGFSPASDADISVDSDDALLVEHRMSLSNHFRDFVPSALLSKECIVSQLNHSTVIPAQRGPSCPKVAYERLAIPIG